MCLFIPIPYDILTVLASLQDRDQLARRAIPPSLRLSLPLFRYTALLPLSCAPPSCITCPLCRPGIVRQRPTIVVYYYYYFLLYDMLTVPFRMWASSHNVPFPPPFNYLSPSFATLLCSPSHALPQAVPLVHFISSGLGGEGLRYACSWCVLSYFFLCDILTPSHIPQSRTWPTPPTLPLPHRLRFISGRAFAARPLHRFRTPAPLTPTSQPFTHLRLSVPFPSSTSSLTHSNT